MVSGKRRCSNLDEARLEKYLKDFYDIEKELSEINFGILEKKGLLKEDLVSKKDYDNFVCEANIMRKELDKTKKEISEFIFALNSTSSISFNKSKKVSKNKTSINPDFSAGFLPVKTSVAAFMLIMIIIISFLFFFGPKITGFSTLGAGETNETIDTINDSSDNESAPFYFEKQDSDFGILSITDVSNCVEISVSGKYRLNTSFVNATDKCIHIKVKDVDFDLAGFGMTGDGSGNGVALDNGLSNVTIRNGFLTSWNYGIHTGTTTTNIVVDGVTFDGTYTRDSIYKASGNGFTFKNNIVKYSGGVNAIEWRSGNTIIENNIFNLSKRLYSVQPTIGGNIIRNNQFIGSNIRCWIDTGAKDLIYNNTFTSGGFIYFYRVEGNGVEVYGNKFYAGMITTGTTGMINIQNSVIRNNYFYQNNANPSSIYLQRGAGTYVLNNMSIHSNYFINITTNSAIRIKGTDETNYIYNNTILTSNRGVWLDSSKNQMIYSNNISTNTKDIYMDGTSANNTFYNNYFKTSNQMTLTNSNYWNTTKSSDTNIIEGPYVGGNFWSDYTGADKTGDGIGNDPANYTLNANNIDYLPLTNNLEIDVDDCMNITLSGGYNMIANISDSSEKICINISASDVIFDCKGFTIDGVDGANSIAVYFESIDNVTVKNCRLNDWAVGVYSVNSTNFYVRDCNATSIDGLLAPNNAPYPFMSYLDDGFEWNNLYIDSGVFTIYYSDNFYADGLTTEGTWSALWVDGSPNININNFDFNCSSCGSVAAVCFGGIDCYGDGSGVDNVNLTNGTIIGGNGGLEMLGIGYLNLDNVEIRDADSYFMKIGSISKSIDNLSITNSYFYNSTGDGILLYLNDTFIIDNSDFLFVEDKTIYTTDSYVSKNTTITNTRFDNIFQAINLYFEDRVLIRDVNITNINYKHDDIFVSTGITLNYIGYLTKANDALIIERVRVENATVPGDAETYYPNGKGISVSNAGFGPFGEGGGAIENGFARITNCEFIGNSIGLYIDTSVEVNVTDNYFEGNNISIWFDYASRVLVENNEFLDGERGIHVRETCRNITITNNKFRNQATAGIYGTIYASYVTNLRNSWIHNNNFTNSATGTGIFFADGGDRNYIYNNNFTNFAVGMHMNKSNVANNTIYNNYFDNTVNAIDNGTTNAWNTTRALGTNIIGGSYMGGNYWSDYTGIDTDGDGIGETNYSIGSSYDYLPLTYNTKSVLYSPENGVDNLLVRQPLFVWYNLPYFGDSTTYQIMIDDNSDFSSPEISKSGIAEGDDNGKTNYTAESKIGVDKIHYWRVRAYNDGKYSEWSDTWNFTVLSSIAISLPVKEINFGKINLTETRDTISSGITPIKIVNDGNVDLDIVVKATYIWNRIKEESDKYQFLINEDKPNSYLSALEIWTNFKNETDDVAITRLYYENDKDSAKLHVRVTVPSDESPFEKSSTITVVAGMGE